jgi:hypothetical protein
VLLIGQPPVPPLLHGFDFVGPAEEHGFQRGAAQSSRPDHGVASARPDAVFDVSDVCVKRQPETGSVSVAWRPAARKGGANLLPADRSRRLDAAGGALVERMIVGLPAGKDEDVGIRASKPIFIQMQIDRAPAAQGLPPDELKGETIEHEKGCLYIRRTAVYHHAEQRRALFGRRRG